MRALVCALLLAAVLGSAPSASAAVAHRGFSCNQREATTSFSSIDVARPSGTQSGDLLIAAIYVDEDDNPGPRAPTGWTKREDWPTVMTDSDPHAAVFSKIATASEPVTYTFTVTGAQAAAIGVSAFSGVDTANPFAGGFTEATGSGSNVPLPGGTATLAGSMRFSTVGNYGPSTTTFQPNLTEACDVVADGSFGFDVVSATAWEPANAGALPSRSATLSGSAPWVAWTAVIRPLAPCSSGALGFTAPSSVAFPPTTLNGYDQTLTSSFVVRVDDQGPTSDGWRLNLTSTPMTSPAETLPATATTITGVTAAPAGGQCSAPVNGVTYPVTVPAGATPPAAATIHSAAAGSGKGPTDLTFTKQLRVPAHASAGSYSSTWTFTLATGP